jgi:hypothetical protein
VNGEVQEHQELTSVLAIAMVGVGGCLGGLAMT